LILFRNAFVFIDSKLNTLNLSSKILFNINMLARNGKTFVCIQVFVFINDLIV